MTATATMTLVAVVEEFIDASLKRILPLVPLTSSLPATEKNKHLSERCSCIRRCSRCVEIFWGCHKQAQPYASNNSQVRQLASVYSSVRDGTHSLDHDRRQYPMVLSLGILVL